MRATAKNKKTSIRKKTPGSVDSKVGNYEKHPFFVKKANEAKALLKAVGLPKKWLKQSSIYLITCLSRSEHERDFILQQSLLPLSFVLWPKYTIKQPAATI